MNLSKAQFPEREEFAKAFFREGLRHLEDARILLLANRIPASIASSAKAAEIVFKSVLILDGAMGWWGGLLTTHKPVTEVKSHLLLMRHSEELEKHRPLLISDVIGLEGLAPSRATAKGAEKDFNQQEVNPEYPFLLYDAISLPALQLREPANHFHEDDGIKFYVIARELASAILARYSDVAAWEFVLPAAL